MDAPKKKFKFTYHWIIFVIGFLMVFTGLGFGSSTRLSYKSGITDEYPDLKKEFIGDVLSSYQSLDASGVAVDEIDSALIEKVTASLDAEAESTKEFASDKEYVQMILETYQKNLASYSKEIYEKLDMGELSDEGQVIAAVLLEEKAKNEFVSLVFTDTEEILQEKDNTSTLSKIFNDDKLDNIFLYGISDSFRYVSTAILNIFFGFFVVKFGARKLVGLGFAALTASCVVCSFATRYWHLYLGALLLGIGFAWTTTTIVGHIVEKWFTNGKGTIMGIILAANGLGGAVSEMIINPMCNEADGLGWRFAYRLTACIFLVIGLLAIIFIRNTPAEKGIEPLGQDAVAKKKRGADWVGFEMNEIWKKPYFYICGICIFLTGMILQSMNGLSKIQIYSVVGKTDEMVDWVTTVFVAHSLVLMVSKILAGSSFDKFGIRFTFGYCSTFAIISLLALVFMTPETDWFAWVYSVCSSIALPLETIMIPLLVSEVFGKKCHAKIMGYYLGLNVFGYACGGPIADFFKQNVGTYNGILIVFCVIMAITALTIQFTFVAAKRDRTAYEKKLALAEEKKD